MKNLSSLTETRALQDNHTTQVVSKEADFITRNVISFPEAEYLFANYRDRINPLLWAGTLCPHRTTEEARSSSTLLVAAVLTVSALHSFGRAESLHATYENFVSLVSSSCLSRAHSLDDIRGLLIGAFYITNLSWRLCGQAVRIATEMNLHQAFQHFVQDPANSHEQVRLWYVLYVNDHQFSIAYGRPPIMHYDMAVRSIERFLAAPQATDGDIRLAAQVTLFRTLAEAYFLYGSDPDQELREEDFEKLRSLSISVDQWRLTWQTRSVDMPIYGAYPSKGAVLYYHFAPLSTKFSFFERHGNAEICSRYHACGPQLGSQRGSEYCYLSSHKHFETNNRGR